ncbi:DUF4232 domain-containing protein [Actinoplanes teichomyceticus]|uniref:Uncharacterized protein DUF4232 n=1 Tax=Actinoplanes teichomyceticus TaxID=1867 RepID=A0A561WK29_ACTTI|nr:DUF4232 domain-containing protein [Actinoplanes teichomyceticus]TWG24222.1 uncharacterized protein DUF4232 [Actinoplanes teichomyceticus]GIF12931.1 hypothetical protein Ate01nite_29630 [Actinoplanes teichomyceticus]
MIGYRAVLPLALLMLLAGCARPSSPSATGPYPPPAPFGPVSRSPAPPAPLACPPEGVRMETGAGDAAMGLRVLGITMVNCGTATYRVRGYPAVRALDEDRAVLDVRILHGAKEITSSVPAAELPPRPVVLRPGQRAGAAVIWRNTYDDIREPPVNPRYLEVAPLAGRPAQVIDPDGGLDLGSTGRIGVAPWTLLPDTPAAPASPMYPPVPDFRSSEPVETSGPLP